MQQRKKGRAPIDADRISRIRSLCQEGVRVRNVARSVGVSMSTVAKYRLMVAGGPMPRSHLDARERQEAVRLCRAGLNTYRIAGVLKRCRQSVARAIDMAGLKGRRTLDKVSDAEIDYIRWAHGQDHTCLAIADHLDRDIATIRRHADKLGLRFRRRGPPFSRPDAERLAA